MSTLRVVIPEESLLCRRFVQNGRFGIATINGALAEFEPKVVFPWHFSMMIHFKETDGEGMPVSDERRAADTWWQVVDSWLKGEEREKPNALFLADILWNGTRELIYRVHAPKEIHDKLQEIIRQGGGPCSFDYRIDNDSTWTLTDWHLKQNAPLKS